MFAQTTRILPLVFSSLHQSPVTSSSPFSSPSHSILPAPLPSPLLAHPVGSPGRNCPPLLPHPGNESRNSSEVNLTPHTHSHSHTHSAPRATHTPTPSSSLY